MRHRFQLPRQLVILILTLNLFCNLASPVQAQPAPEKPANQVVKLYYLREASKIAAILNGVKDLKPIPPEFDGLFISSLGDDEIVLFGLQKQRDYARRLIVTLDLPRPGINMEMWGIQISSQKAEKMAQVMPQVREEISKTQAAVRSTYTKMQQLAREIVREEDVNGKFKTVLVGDLFYRTALDRDRPLSFPDILLRFMAANNPADALTNFARQLDQWLEAAYPENFNFVTARGHRPFDTFFDNRGIHFKKGWTPDTPAVTLASRTGQAALLDFALHYGQLVHEPSSFSAYSLQRSAETLNSRLQETTDALNSDMQMLFVEPTLERIRAKVRKFKDVEYAQVGKTSVSSLSGIATEVTSYSVNAFDVTPPLRLSELLDKATKLSNGVAPFDPAKNVVGALPLSQVIGLIGAFGEERSVWRELKAGVSVTITPNVLRNMTSAELAVNLKTGDPQAGTREQGVRPLSRVSQHDVKTSIYVTGLDFFDLSAFASQSTLNGGRGYIPIIGPVWEGLFGSIPVAGQLFSWPRSPKTVFQESLVLTNSFITPTVMGVAVLYPTERFDPRTGQPEPYNFKTQSEKVREYIATLELR